VVGEPTLTFVTFKIGFKLFKTTNFASALNDAKRVLARCSREATSYSQGEKVLDPTGWVTGTDLGARH